MVDLPRRVIFYPQSGPRDAVDEVETGDLVISQFPTSDIYIGEQWMEINVSQDQVICNHRRVCCNVYRW